MTGLVAIQTPHCIVCGKQSMVLVDPEGLKAWQQGALIQRAFPAMSSCNRELLISGTHPECFKELYGEED